MFPELREALADLEHDRWSRWMKYMFSKGQFNEDGTWTMPAWAVERWQGQSEQDYGDLSEEEKDSDRREANNTLDLLAAMGLFRPKEKRYARTDGRIESP